MFCRCGNVIPRDRADLLHREGRLVVCLDCGKANATAETARKASLTAPLFNKGAVQFLGSDPKTIRENLLAAGRKVSQVEGPEEVKPVMHSAPKKLHPMFTSTVPKEQAKRRQVGVYWKDGDKLPIYEGDKRDKFSNLRSAIWDPSKLG